MAQTPADGLGAIAHANAFVDPAEGVAHGVAANAQLAADLLGVVALPHQAQQLLLAAREPSRVP